MVPSWADQLLAQLWLNESNTLPTQRYEDMHEGVWCKKYNFWQNDSYENLDHFSLIHVLRHKAGQEGRGEILLENSFRRWRCYQGKIMHTTSNNCSVLYVLKKKHRQHNNTMTPPTLLFLASWPSYTRASCHSKIYPTKKETHHYDFPI